MLRACRRVARMLPARQLEASACHTGSAAPDTLRSEKTALRRVLKSRLRQLSDEEMAVESQKIAQRVLASAFYQRCERVGLYIHCAQLREVDTRPLLQALLLDSSRARCYVPVIEDRNSNMHLLHLDTLDGLRPAPPFNILEPTPLYSDGSPRENVLHADAPLQLLLMPGLAFDRAGRRCGRAGGYYDKLLARLLARAASHGWPPPLLVALAFDVQMVDEVPVEPHDKNVDIIVTAGCVLPCSPRAHQLLEQEGPGKHPVC